MISITTSHNLDGFLTGLGMTWAPLRSVYLGLFMPPPPPMPSNTKAERPSHGDHKHTHKITGKGVKDDPIYWPFALLFNNTSTHPFSSPNLISNLKPRSHHNLPRLPLGLNPKSDTLITHK